jgi:FkbM family methyltransferase
MTYRLAKSLLDWPGGRFALGHLVTARARARGNAEQIFYDDGCWIHRFGKDAIANWEPSSTRNLPVSLTHAQKHWLSFYCPSQGETVVEVGAGIGVESILYSRAVGRNGRVIAIEAHPRTYKCLVKTCEYNSLANVTPLNIALVDREQIVSIEDNLRHIGNAILPDAGAGPIQVRGRSLDDVCAELGVGDIGVIRTNIEGAEKFVIEGMNAVIRRIAHAKIACHDFKADRTGNDFFRTKTIITEFLQDHGFEIVQMFFEEAWAKDYVFAYNRALTGNPLRARWP